MGVRLHQLTPGLQSMIKESPILAFSSALVAGLHPNSHHLPGSSRHLPSCTCVCVCIYIYIYIAVQNFIFYIKPTSLTYFVGKCLISHLAAIICINPLSHQSQQHSNKRNLNEIKFHKHFSWDFSLWMVNNGNYFFTLLFCHRHFSLTYIASDLTFSL